MERSWEERREFFRVDGEVLLRYREVSEEEREAILKQTSAQQLAFFEEPPLNKGPNVESHPEAQIHPERLFDEQVLKRLNQIEEKLNVIMNKLIAPVVPKDEFAVEPCLVNISGSGMRFPTRERFEIGTWLEVVVVLPVIPDRYMRLLGQVVHTMPTLVDGGQDFNTAIKFESILEDDREQIIRYTFLQQAQRIRYRRNERGEALSTT
jgi:hypothetical protein